MEFLGANPQIRKCARILLVAGAQIFLAALGCAQTVSPPEPPQVRAKNHVLSLTLHAVNENGRDAFAFDGGKVAPVIRASPDSFRVAWTERSYENGQLAATERWTAILTIAVQQPRDADRLKENPLGIYVNAINWSKELGQ